MIGHYIHALVLTLHLIWGQLPYAMTITAPWWLRLPSKDDL